MDNCHHDPQGKDASERKNLNTEWLPTKCRITKPPPPKPAANPLQFIKVAPCPLFQKAHEQIKKVEEIKIKRQDLKDDAEEWQQNLDNWKSSRRKRQEHIIERVVEVKKFEQEGQDRGRRKSKTFNEMLEERNKRGHRLNIPIYDDDSNDLSDYGIGSSSSKTNSTKDVDTDDSSSVLDDKDHNSISDSHSVKDISNQSQSEDEMTSTNLVNKENSLLLNSKTQSEFNNGSKINTNSIPNSYSSSFCTNLSTKNISTKTVNKSMSETNLLSNNNFETPESPQYTYEGAIQDYRTRIKSKINIDETIFNKHQDQSKHNESTEPQKHVPKIDVCKRKEMFEVEKRLEIRHFESNTTKRLSEDFANSQSIKERLKNLEKCTDQPIKSVDKGSTQVGSVKSRIKSLTQQNVSNSNAAMKEKGSPTKSISSYLLDKSNNNTNIIKSDSTVENNTDWRVKEEIAERCSSPEAQLFMDKLNMFNRDLDSYLGKTHQNNLEDYREDCTVPAAVPVLSTELLELSLDREDSGIHTADVSCSVSQADEAVEEADIFSSTIPYCIEKLNKEKEKYNRQKEVVEESLSENTPAVQNIPKTENLVKEFTDKKELINTTREFLENIKREASNDFVPQKQQQKVTTSSIILSNEGSSQKCSKPEPSIKKEIKQVLDQPKDNKMIIYENVHIRNCNPIVDDVFVNSTFSLAPPKSVEPPKEKPPPPPPPDDDTSPGKSKQANVKRLNSAKRIKKEIHIKRSSFLGLDEPTDDQFDPEIPIDRPPDINTFLQKESQLEKSLYKKLQGSREICLSEVESQDSGLESERGRLSSDTWCSSIGDSSTPTHGRQDSEQTNSVTSEEDEITKKEREIIELVEKEEKSRDVNEFPNTRGTPTKNLPSSNNRCVHKPIKDGDQFNRHYFPQPSNNSNNSDDRDSEVLKVEHELLQLERDELERRRENLIFRESRAKMYHQENRHSLENICDRVNMFPPYPENVNHRKSMPELQKEIQAYDYHQKPTPEVPYYYKSVPDIDAQYRKSVSNIQQAYVRSVPDFRKSMPEVHNDLRLPLEHRKSMPDLDHDLHMSAFRSPATHNRQPIKPGKPLRPLIKEQREKERLNSTELDSLRYPNPKGNRPITRPGLHALSAVPKPRPIPNDNWIQPTAENKTKSYNQHWVYQEAELRRIADQQKNGSPKRNRQVPRQEKHIPDPIIQTLTQRIQNRIVHNERNQPARRPENNPNKEYTQRPYLNHPHTMGHASPVAYPPPTTPEDSQGKMLSVSGKKKCSYCRNELGRGAAMIIESLCLFYHMECFKCCVCHTQLGDGLMGTDVRVRNQKLHCHNCYSSDDGVKFSCV